MKNLLFIIPILLLFVSCTEQIEIDLNSVDPQIVVEGGITTKNDETTIKLTNSINFDDSNDFPVVEDAVVEISDNLGNSELLNELLPGVYLTNELKATIGNTYYLTITKDDKVLKSNSTIPNQVPFDSLIVVEFDGSGTGGIHDHGESKTHDVFVAYNDPENEINYYRFIELKNDTIISSYIFDDRLTNGSYTKSSLMSFDRNLSSGDTLKVIMQCIEENVYEYFNSFGNLKGGPGGSTTPANPYTNIEGGILGYFSAHTYKMKEVIIP